LGKKTRNFRSGALGISAWSLPTRHKYFQIFHLTQKLDLSLRYQPLKPPLDLMP
jgi:hypothetical protein